MQEINQELTPNNIQKNFVNDLPKTDLTNSQMWLLELFGHARNKRLTPGDRISRWEYLIATVPFSIITTILSVLVYKTLWLNWYTVVSIVLGIISLIMSIRLVVARFHDLDKSWRNVFWFLSPIVIWILWLLFYGWLFLSKNNYWINISNDIINIANIILWISILVSLIFLIILAVQLIFYKWTVGTNRYGNDPLPNQPTSNLNYRLIYIFTLLITGILSYTMLPNTNFANMDLSNRVNTWSKYMNMLFPNNNILVDTWSVTVTDDSGSIIN